MILLVDSRETKPLQFKIEGVVSEVRVVKLDVGDYGCEYTDGTKCPVYFERKSIGDLFGTLTSGHKRFRKEIDRANESKVKLILAVEGSINDVISGYKHSSWSGHSIVKKMMTLWVRYGVEPMFCSTRVGMAYMIRECFEAFGRTYKMKKTG